MKTSTVLPTHLAYDHSLCILTCRLWETLVEGALVQRDKDVAFEWFYNVLQDHQSMSGHAEHCWASISQESSQLLLTEKMAHLDPSTMSEHGYRCFASYFNAVGSKHSMPCHALDHGDYGHYRLEYVMACHCVSLRY